MVSLSVYLQYLALGTIWHMKDRFWEKMSLPTVAKELLELNEGFRNRICQIYIKD